ncbi:MAG TPA: tyrosine-type recombinase/integrase [Bacteroidales bacterium]|nr:tyrosine-type recombinase/integrase [Bacteroidales bacterium]
MASLYKRDLKNGNWTWVLQWYVKQPNGTTKKRYKHLGSISKTRAKQIKSAKESKLAEEKFALLFGDDDPEITPLTIAALKVKFIDIKKHQVKHTTIKLYENMFKHLRKCLPDLRTDEFDRAHILEYRNYLVQKGFKAPTVNKHMKLLKAVLNEAVYTLKALESNPFNNYNGNGGKIKPLPEEKENPHVMPPEHIQTFFREFDKTIPKELRDYTFFHTMYCIGCRPGELSRLTWDKVYLDEEIPYIVFPANTTKANKENPVPIPSHLVEDYKILQEEMQPEDGDRVYPHIRLSDRSHPSTIFHQYTKRAKIDEERLGANYTPYWLRHTLGSTSDAPIQDISALYNHSDVKVTQKYSHRQNLQRKAKVVNSYPAWVDLIHE